MSRLRLSPKFSTNLPLPDAGNRASTSLVRAKVPGQSVRSKQGPPDCFWHDWLGFSQRGNLLNEPIPQYDLTDVTVDLDYFANRWKHGSVLEKLLNLMHAIRKGDSFRLPIFHKPGIEFDQIIESCKTIGLEPTVMTNNTAADVCADTLLDGGTAVSGNMRLFPFMKDGGTIYRPLFKKWEMYSYGDWTAQYSVSPEHWDRFVDLIDGGMRPHHARKHCTHGDPSCQITPVRIPGQSLSADTMGHILQSELTTRRFFE